MYSSPPAHTIKHLPHLQYPFGASTFHLVQSDAGISNGTTLWLGSQCLSAFLSTLQPSKNSGMRAIELGSGIGLTALALSSLGYNVIATDTQHVMSTVLTQNLASNLAQLPPGSGKIEARVLDWCVPPDQWVWDNDSAIASGSLSSPEQTQPIPQGLDLIITADTVYEPSLIEPLLRTLHALSTLSLASSSTSTPSPARAPPVFVCLERRDPAVVERTLESAKNNWGFTAERVPHKKLVKAMEKCGLRWKIDDWEGIEIWKLSLSRG